ncbi:MAG: PHP domain-containing protein [Myxococcota bacterium]
MNEYGVFRGDERIAGATEEEVFAAVGLPWIPPELREGQGEIEAAESGRLPTLIAVSDLRGDLHMHTDASDGRSTLREMADAAMALGRDYIAITDHSHNLTIARGMDASRLAEQGRAIDQLNAELGGRLRVLKGLEADILPDGTVDMPDQLAGLEWRIGSLHSHLQLPRDEQTKRVIRAIESGLVDVIGHPTGRMIESRAPSDLDMEAIMVAAARCGVALEVNAFPDRLDLSDAHCRLARELGTWLVIDTDAHAAGHLSGLHFGVDVARRGWLEPRHVLNTYPLAELLRRPRPPRPA